MVDRPSARLFRLAWVLPAACVGLLPACVPPAAGDAPLAPPVDEAPPEGRLPADVRPLSYDLHFRVDPAAPRFSGEAVVEIELARARDVIWMHGLDLEVSAATLTLADGRVIAGTWAQIDEWGGAKLSLPEVVAPQHARLDLRWSAAYREDLSGLYKADVAGQPYIHSHLEAISARAMFPGFDEPAFKTPYTVSVTAPAAHEVITNTPEVSREPDGDGFTRRRFAPTPPLPTYLVAVQVGPFDVVSGPDVPPSSVRAKPLPIRGVSVRGRGAELAWALQITGPMILALEDYFQSPYPFEKLDLVAVADFEAGAMENPGAITYRESILLLPPNPGVERERRLASITAHELAHMWFGDLVTMPWWDDIWLNESFADWMALKVMAQWGPQYEAGLEELAKLGGTMGADSLKTARSIRQPIRTNHDIFGAFDTISYEKGAAVLGMFESWMGPDTFRDGIRLHMKAHAYGTADAEDLLASLSQAAGRDVATPFRTFLLQPGVPWVEAKVRCLERGAELDLSQARYVPLGSPIADDPSAAGAQWEIPVCYRYEQAGGVRAACTLLTEPEATIPLEGEHCPAWLLPNTEGVGYYRFGMDPAALEALLGHWEALSVRERLALADSLVAGLSAGKVPFATVMQTLPRLAADPHRQVAALPIALLEGLWSVTLPADLRPEIEALARRIYQPVLAGLGARAPGESAELGLFRRDVEVFLATVGRDPEVRARLAAMGAAFVDADGVAHPERLDPAYGQAALSIAVQERGAPFYDALRTVLDQTNDGGLRWVLLFGLGATTDPTLRERTFDLRYSDAIRANEGAALAISAGSQPENRDAIWAWHVEHKDRVLEHLPPMFEAFLPYLVAGACDDARSVEFDRVFGPVVAAAPGGPPLLAAITEEIHLCGAARSAWEADARAWFAAH